MDRVPYIDQSGLYAMEDAVLNLRQRDVTVLLTGVNTQPMDMMRRIDIVPALVPESQIFDTFEDSIAWLKAHRSGAEAKLV
jgi:SulP family sulfate permease